MGGVSVIISSPEGDTLKYGIQLRFPATNNEAEYKMILTRLRVAKALGAKNVLLKCDSRLVVRQINEEFEAKENKMQKYLKLTNQLIGEADEVAKYASSEDKTSLLDLKLEMQRSSSTEEFQTFSIQDHTSYTSPILFYLRDGQLPPDSNEVRKIKKHATRFTILNGVLYKRGFSQPYLRCIEKDESKYILEEVHEGICWDHMGARSLVGKIMRAGYF